MKLCLKVVLFMLFGLNAHGQVPNDLQFLLPVPEAQKIVSKPASAFFQAHRLLFFYASTCPYCQRFAPVLKNWALSHQALVQAFSFDEEPLPGFKNTPLTNELVKAAFQDQSIKYPALFILNDKTRTLYPVAIGALDSAELTIRMQKIIPKIMHYERGQT